MDWSPQGSLSMELPRQEYWSGFPFPSPGDLPKPGIEPASPALQEDSLSLSHQGSPLHTISDKKTQYAPGHSILPVKQLFFFFLYWFEFHHILIATSWSDVFTLSLLLNFLKITSTPQSVVLSSPLFPHLSNPATLPFFLSFSLLSIFLILGPGKLSANCLFFCFFFWTSPLLPRLEIINTKRILD